MSSSLLDPTRPQRRGFQHEALLYEGHRDFLARTAPFVRDGVRAGEPVLVVVGSDKIAALRDVLGDDADRVHWADMAEVGRNPARIIPAWQAFLGEHASDGGPLRGVGEPVWAGRTPVELDECRRHEALLNVAFDHELPWTLLCPYDVAALEPAAVEAAHHTHPVVRHGDDDRSSSTYIDAMDPFAGDLPPVSGVANLPFTVGPLDAVRRFVHGAARSAGLRSERTDDLLLAVSELAANSLRHGGGVGEALAWTQDGSLLCEVRDLGRLTDPLAGRRSPASTHEGSRGLWLVNQLCDLVQIRSSAAGTVVRCHMYLA